MRRTYLALLAIIALAGAAMLSACPNISLVPFDTTGTYEGTWEGTVEGSDEEITACLMNFTLDQGDGQEPLVTGSVDIDFSCSEIGELLQNFNQPTQVTVPVSGVLAPNGTLYLARGNCPGGVLCVALFFGGQGADTTGDGFMDSYSGEWSFTLLVPVQEVGQIQVEGSFTAEHVDKLYDGLSSAT